jgi:hypothetical protein
MIPTLHPFKTSVITRGSILTKSVLEEKNAIEYMQDDMRECGNSRGKTHSVITTNNQDDEKDGMVNTLQMQMQENQRVFN